MEVKIKKLVSTATTPKYAKSGDAGMDLVAVSKEYTDSGFIKYGTGLSFEIPVGYVGLVFPRSSVVKTDLALANSVGVIDSGYRGEVSFCFKGSILACDAAKLSDVVEYEIGDRVGQIIIIPYPEVEFTVVDELSSTDRGDGGYGSTGN